MEIDIDDNSYKNAIFLNKNCFLLRQSCILSIGIIRESKFFKAVSLKTSQFVHKSQFLFSFFVYLNDLQHYK